MLSKYATDQLWNEALIDKVKGLAPDLMRVQSVDDLPENTPAEVREKVAQVLAESPGAKVEIGRLPKHSPHRPAPAPSELD